MAHTSHSDNAAAAIDAAAREIEAARAAFAGTVRNDQFDSDSMAALAALAVAMRHLSYAQRAAEAHTALMRRRTA